MLHCNETAGDHPRRRPTPSSASTPATPCAPTAYGRRAADLARLTALGLPVPPGIALSFDCVAALAAGGPMPDLPLGLAARPPPRAALQPRGARLGRPQRHAQPRRLRPHAVDRLAAAHRRRRRARASTSASSPASARRCTASTPRTSRRWPPPPARAADPDAAALRALLADMLRFFEDETGEPWPQDPAEQLEAAARAMARAWNAPPRRASCARPRARPRTAGLGLVVQRLAARPRPRRQRRRPRCSSVSSRTGAPELHRRLRPARPGHPPRRPRRRPAADPRRAQTARPAAGDRPDALDALAAAPSAPPPASATPASIDFALEDGRDRHPRRRCRSAATPAPPSASPSTSPTPAPSPATRRCSASSRAA